MPRLSDDERDRFVEEQRTAARWVGIDPSTTPRSLAELNAYMQSMQQRLTFTPDARSLVKESMLGPKPGGSSWIERTLACDFLDKLPPVMCQLYGCQRSKWERWTTAFFARFLTWGAGTSVPYEMLLRQLRQDARDGALCGRVRRADQPSEPPPPPAELPSSAV